MQSLPILTLQAAESLLRALEDYLEKSEASLALVIDRGGTILSMHGEAPESTNTEVLAALAAGSFAATRELALRIGENEFAALYQQGGRHHILMTAVDDDIVLVTVFGTRTTVGLVRFYSARAARRIAAVVRDLHANPPQVALPITELDLAGTDTVFNP
jgi:predicted regulator of Ras-like GTPase activity (Roadblock/LC7/MglB family)